MENPFKLLESYKESESEVFFGRDSEIASLYNLLQKTRLVLVYGPSGTGKTSLIRAGMPKVFKLSEWFPISISRKENINDSLKRELRKITQKENLSLTDSVKEIFEKKWMPIYLIFDQFEEIFTLGEDDEQKVFFKNLKVLLENDLPCNIILSMREEYIGYLYEYEKYVTQLFDHRFRVEPMKDETVCRVIEKTCFSYNIGIQDSEIPKMILGKIKTEKQPAYLPYLQIYLFSLFEIRSEKEPVEFTLDAINELGDLERVLKPFITSKEEDAQVYLSRKYDSIPADFSSKLLDEFSTEEGTKKPQKINDLKNVLGVSALIVKDALQYFQANTKFIKIDEDNKDRYELMHDILAKLIFELRTTENKEWKKFLYGFQRDFNRWETEKKNSSRLLTDEDLSRVDLYETRLKNRNSKRYNKYWLPYINQSRDFNKKKKRRRQNTFTLISIIAIIAVGLGSYAFYEKSISSRIVKHTDFFESLALAIEERTGKYGYMDSKGKIQIDFIYDEATPFNRYNNYLYGYARVKRDGKDFLLDTHGKEFKIAYNQYDLTDDVTILDLSEKKLHEFPSYILENPQLKILILRDNELRNTPSDILELKELEYLDLSNNLIDSIALALCKLPSLKRLGLAWNPINNIPNYFGELHQLEFLDLSYCNISELPIEFFELEELNTLFISGNSIKEENSIGSEMQLNVLVNNNIDTSSYTFELPKMIHVKGGEFEMGKSYYGGKRYAGKSNEEPIHIVKLDDFYIGQYEITQAFWKSVMGYNPSAQEGCELCPVDKVSWYNAKKFLYRLNKITGKQYRLPTEAEWEYAAKGGINQNSYIYAGSNNIDSVAWYFYELTNGPHEVGTKKPNSLELFDMSGNLWEWCEDSFDSTFYKKCFDLGVVHNPVNTTTSKYGVYRGGDWFNADKHYCQVTFRGPSLRNNNARQVGLRIVLDKSD